MRNMKKIIAFLLAVCTIAGTMTSLMMVSGGMSVYADETTDAEVEEGAASNYVDAWSYFKTKYANDNEKLHTMTMYIQSEDFELWGLKTTGEVAIKNRKTGQIMFSNPRDTSLYSKKEAEDREDEPEEFKQMASQLYVDFTVIAEGNNSTTKLYSYSDAAMNNQITMSVIKNGVAVEYVIGRGDDRKLVPMWIEKTRYEENILNLIEDPNIYKRMSTQGGIYSLKDPTTATGTQQKTMYKDYPVTKPVENGGKGYAIYVCDENISNLEINRIESWIRAWAPKYTFEQLEKDHEDTKYPGNNKVLPVFKMALEYKLTEDGFTVRLPASSITFDEDYFRLNEITILPFMGAGSSQYDGFTMIPDGSGSIIKFEDVRTQNRTNVIGTIYGLDNSYYSVFEADDDTLGKSQIWRYPIFGMVENFYRYMNQDGTEYCGHSLRELHETVLPTCSVDGYSTYKCKLCGNISKPEDIVPAGHPESRLKPVSALGYAGSCVSVSQSVYVCLDCGDYVYKYGEAVLDPAKDASHKYETLENGDSVCVLCKKYKAAPAEEGTTEALPEGYKLDASKSKAPTCTEFGVNVYTYQPDADEEGNVPEFDPADYPDIVRVGAIPAGHAVVVKKINSGCSDGHLEVSCKNCSTFFGVFGNDYPEAPVGYTPDSKLSKVPTCTEDGQIVFTMAEKDNIVINLSAKHNYVVITNITHDAENKTIVTTYTAICTSCSHKAETVENIEIVDGITHLDIDGVSGYIIKNNPVKATSASTRHRWVTIVSVASNCEAGIKGYTAKRCSCCGEIEFTAQPDAHEWSDKATVMYAPTLTTTGLNRYTCSSCGCLKYEVTDMLATDNVESVELKDITLTITGEGTVTGEIILEKFEYNLEEVKDMLVYTTNNANAVTVENGIVTAVAAGKATITVELIQDETVEYRATCIVYVEEKDSSASSVLQDAQPENTIKVYDPRGYFAIITEGESLCKVTSMHGGNSHKYNNVYLTVTPRPSDTYTLTGAITATGNTDAKYTVVSDRKYTGSYRLRYYMLSDQETSDFDASYAGMAKAYRYYLESTNQVTTLKAGTSIPLYVEVLGSVTVNDTFMSIPITRAEALTTFDDIITINNELKKAGITNIQYRLTGFTNGGMTPTMPYDIAYEDVVGGNDGYKKFVEYAKKNGIGVYTDYDFAYMHTNKAFDGYSDGDHAIKAIDSRYIIKKTYNATVQAFTSTGLLAVSPSVFEYFYDHMVKEDKKLGSIGISVSTLGSDLNSDFDKDEPFNREDSKAFVEEVMGKMEKDYSGNVMTDCGNSYVIPYAKHVLNMALVDSQRAKTSAGIPFVSMVLHGAVQYAGKPTNMASSMDEEILRIIENGASPYFVLAYRNQSALKENTTLSKYYAVSFSHWKNDIVSVYTELNNVLSKLQSASYNSHEYLVAERVPGVAEYERSRDKMIKDVVALIEKVEAAELDFENAKALVAQFTPTEQELAAIVALAEKVNSQEATEAEKLELAYLINDMDIKTKAANKYQTNISEKQSALSEARKNLNQKLDSIEGLFNVTDKTDKTQYTVENYKGYGSYDADGKYTPRAEDFIGEDGEYMTTEFTVSDYSVVRTGWDLNGDKKDDVVIYLNYNAFDVYVYENGNAITIPARQYKVV